MQERDGEDKVEFNETVIHDRVRLILLLSLCVFGHECESVCVYVCVCVCVSLCLCVCVACFHMTHC